MSIIDIENKVIYLNQHSIPIGEGKFIDIANASLDMITNLLANYTELNSPLYLIGMETPPIGAWYTEKLWSLDTLLYRSIFNPYVFNPSYISYIHGTKKYKKKDTMEMIDKCFDIFVKYGYTISQQLCSEKTGKPRKITDNEADASVYSIRLFIKHYLENNEESDIVNEILELFPRFREVKEEH